MLGPKLPAIIDSNTVSILELSALNLGKISHSIMLRHMRWYLIVIVCNFFKEMTVTLVSDLMAKRLAFALIYSFLTHFYGRKQKKIVLLSCDYTANHYSTTVFQ